MLIIYRCCEDNLTRNHRGPGIIPDWMDKRKCFKSLINSLELSKNKHELHITHDGPSGPLEEYIRQFGFEIHKTSHQSQLMSLLNSVQVAKNHLDKDIYFLEDDYLHFPNAITVFEEGLTRFDIITGFDHPDRYRMTDDITNGKEEITFTPSSHWRTSESTTHTFLVSKRKIADIIDIIPKFQLEDRAMYRYIYIKKGIRLWSTIPAVAEHPTIKYASPVIDAVELNRSIIL